MIEVRHDGKGDCARDGEKRQNRARARLQKALQKDKQQDTENAAQRVVDDVHHVAGADFQDVLRRFKGNAGRAAHKRLRPHPFP